MKKHCLHIFIITLAIGCLSLPSISFSEEEIQLEVDAYAICETVSNFEPVGSSVNFPASVGKLCCFTTIVGAQEPTTITHVWYFGMTERAKVDLNVKGIRWRTHSSKIIQANEVGSWRVEIMDSEGTVLKVIQFITTSELEAVSDKIQATEPAVEEGTEESTKPTSSE